MREINELLLFSEKHQNEDLVLCTLTNKVGSSYRSVGAQKIVSLQGSSAGFLSGGCLENEIEKTAREILSGEGSHETFKKTFSTASEEDRLLGYQSGCQGIIEVSFEKLERPLDLYRLKLRLGYAPLKVVILGCGADAYPFVDLILDLGWELEIFDYRKNLAESFNYRGIQAQWFRVGDEFLAASPPERTALILMTHNYEADLEIVKSLSKQSFFYIGCIGPARRWQMLKEDLWKFHKTQISEAWESKVKAPAGIFTKGHSPTEIALSIVAQIQGEMSHEETKKINTKNTCVILAAGASSRFGGPKFLATWQGRNFLEIAIEKARALVQENYVVVTGAWHEAMKPYLIKSNFVFNSGWAEGMGSSIRVGFEEIQRLYPSLESVTVLLLDQPEVEISHLQQLQKISELTHRVAFTTDGRTSGPPAVVPKKFLQRVGELRGERGLKSIIAIEDQVTLGNIRALQDYDTKAQLNAEVL